MRYVVTIGRTKMKAAVIAQNATTVLVMFEGLNKKMPISKTSFYANAKPIRRLA